MEKRVSRTRAARERSPPSSRTRSKSPARVEVSGRDSAPIKKTRTATRKVEKDSEESSSQSSTPKKLQKAGKKEKEKQVNVMDDSADNEEVADINARSTRLSTLRKRTSPVTYKNTPTPSTTDEIKRSVSRTASSLTKEDSDEDEEEVKLVPSQPDLQSLGIYTKPFVNFLLLIVLAIFPIIIATASKVGWKCSLIIAEFKNIENFVTVQSFSLSVAVHTLSVLVSLLPVGRFVKLPDSEKEYKFNGTLAAFVLTGILFAMEFKNLDSFSAVVNNADRLLFLSIAKCLLISIVLNFIHKYNFRVMPNTEPNQYGNTGKYFTDLLAGRELNPKPFGFVDAKRIIYVQSVMYILVLNIGYMFKNITIPVIETATEGSPINELIKQTYSNFINIIQNSEYNLAGFVASSLLILYALDLLIFEHHLATSFQLNDEGMGAEVFLRFAGFPFLISILPRYLFANNIVFNCNCQLAFTAVIFIIGLVIKRCSNCLKYEYRLHPNDAKYKGEIFCGFKEFF